MFVFQEMLTNEDKLAIERLKTGQPKEISPEEGLAVMNRFIASKYPQIAENLKDIMEEEKGKYTSSRTFELGEFYAKLRNEGIEKDNATWTASLFLVRPEGGFISNLFSSPASPIENRYTTADEMYAIYKFVVKMDAVVRKDSDALKGLTKEQKTTWQIIINRKNEYIKDNSGKPVVVSWLMDEIESLRKESRVAGFGDSGSGQTDKAVYKLLEAEFGKLLGTDAKTFLESF